MTPEAQSLYAYYVQQGLTPVQAAGFVGRLMQESSPSLNTSLVGDNGTAYGLAQWRGDRWSNVQNWMKAQGLDPSDRMSQAKAALWELQNSEPRAWALLQNAKSVPDAVNAAMAYERPAGWTAATPEAGHGYGQTLKYAGGLLGTDVSQVQASATPAAVSGQQPQAKKPDLGQTGMGILDQLAKQRETEQANALRVNQNALANAPQLPPIQQPRFRPVGYLGRYT